MSTKLITKTVSMKLKNLPHDEYLQLLSDASNMFNEYTAWCFKRRTWSKKMAHDELYFDMVKRFPSIKTALVQTIRDAAMEAVKATKFKYSIPQMKPTSSLRLDSRCFKLRGHQLSIIGISKRHKEILDISDYAQKYLDSWKICGATLAYHQNTKSFVLNTVFSKNLECADVSNSSKVVGIDRGIHNIVAMSNGKIISGSELRKIRRKYLYKRRTLQQKGTQSANRRLKSIGRKEQRFMLNANRNIAKQLASLDFDVYVLEDLNNTRKRKGSKLNKRLSDWTYGQLEVCLRSKLDERGKLLKHVPPQYTSQRCSNCGNVDKSGRNKSKYVCKCCGSKIHADTNAAINIRDSYILSTTFVGGAGHSQLATCVKLPKLGTQDHTFMV